MDFFQAQDAARRSTFWLVVLFVLAVIGLVVLTNLLVVGVIIYIREEPAGPILDSVLAHFHTTEAWVIGLGVVVLVGLGSLFRMLQLAGGGPAVAEALGASPVPRDSADPLHRALLNVVEEMAIASGTPVPRVYLMDEPGINAFAAGWTPNDAVVAVTRGAVELLSRDELQGVVAHEFSHILNGDMRLNIRLAGVLYGILLLGELGYYIMRSLRHVRPSRSEKGGGGAVAAILALGLGLMLIGYTGTFFGNWIKSLVSRQREFLADASAVQFTRNRDGISGALKKIGAGSAGSLLQSPASPEFSHAYFARGVASTLYSIFPTHPPLEKRIKRLDPRWDGRFVEPVWQRPAGPQDMPEGKAEAATMTAVLGAAVTASVRHTGRPDQEQQDYARELLTRLPPEIREASANPQSARALMYALVLDTDDQLQTRQWQVIDRHADGAVALDARKLIPMVAALEPVMRLPLIDLCLPTLRALSVDQYQQFREVLTGLMAADKKIRLSEWVLQYLVLRSLDMAFGLRKPARQVHAVLGSAKQGLETILSLIAHAEHADAAEAERAFATGRGAIGAGALTFVPPEQLNLKQLDQAMLELERMKSPLKRRFLEACAACIAMDGSATVKGFELLRAVAGGLDCPMPPVPQPPS